MIPLPSAAPGRTIFAHESPVAIIVFYCLAVISIAVFFYGWGRRLAKYRAGRSTGCRLLRPAPAGSSGTGPGTTGHGGCPVPEVVAGVNATPGTAGAVLALVTNRTVRRRSRAVGLAHLAVFWGFAGLLVATTIVAIDYDVYGHLVTGLLEGRQRSFFNGDFYLAFNAVFDAAGVAALGGTLYLLWRRARAEHFHPQLDYRRAEQPDAGYSRSAFVAGDWLFIGVLVALLFTGFVVQGLRIDESHFPPYERWTWMGWLFARALTGVGIGAEAATTVHSYLWWLHASMALGFVAYLPFSKAMHIVTSGADLLVTDPSTTRCLPPPPAAEGRAGYEVLTDFTRKELLDLDACTKCGRCHAVCPARAAGAALSPRDLILDLRQWAERQRGIRPVLDWETRPDATGPAATGPGVSLAGDVVKEHTLWACTTCMACVEACPVGIEHVPTIVQLRRSLVDQGRMEPRLQTALQNLAQQGNSFGKSARMRARWTKALDFSIPDARKEHVDLLWFVGDHASFDERLQELSRTLARVLHRSGVSFGLLYDEERNSGNDVRRVGEEGLFEMLVEHNLAAFTKSDFSEIFTTDPHSFNTLRNEYPGYGLEKRVRHYTQVLADLLEEGAIPVRPLGRRVTYHDPCYLGRYNRVVQAPRRVLRSLGCETVEMPRNKDNTFCCGAGGGRIWMDDSHLTERPSEMRIKEAAELGVDTFVVSCPKDYAMYSDAVKTTGHADHMTVRDIVQLVDEASTAPGALGVASGVAVEA
ncbi:MAG: heterodisulfide reductase-related iron-sulfur binding cluster [Actinomycetota bacterium]|nr:heterodisulfide reductase-related iron-sulfur binding cluster [Actinomycetota bacterium]